MDGELLSQIANVTGRMAGSWVEQLLDAHCLQRAAWSYVPNLVALAQIRRLGREAEPTYEEIVELGAGKGMLARDILSQRPSPKFTSDGSGTAV